MKKILAVLSVMFLAVILKAEIIGYEYAINKKEAVTVSYLDVMVGIKGSTEKYETITRSVKQGISTTLDTAVKDGKAYKQVVYETKDVRPNGITATFIRKEGIMPADLNYDSKKEKQKRIDDEFLRREKLRVEKVKKAIEKDFGY